MSKIQKCKWVRRKDGGQLYSPFPFKRLFDKVILKNDYTLIYQTCGTFGKKLICVAYWKKTTIKSLIFDE